MPNKISPEEYQEILGGLELLNIKLIKLTSALDEEYFDQTMNIKINDDAKFEIKKENLITIINTYNINLKSDNKDKEALKIKIGYEISFSCKKEFTKEFFEVYKKISLPLNIWPFVRELINSLTSRMNIPPITLPLLKRP